MIILASASPRRKELLKTIIDDFEIVTSNIDESIPDNIKKTEAAEYLATKKAMDIHSKYPNDLIIAADTVIVYNDEIYGKPKSSKNAKEMLAKFSGNIHYVITGVCIISKQKNISFSSVNKVEFYKLSNEEIDAYLQNDEYKDKAGSYAIQGKGGLFVKEIKGDYNSIVGLPISHLSRILKNFFNI